MTMPNDKDRAAGDHGGEYADEAKKTAPSRPPREKPATAKDGQR